MSEPSGKKPLSRGLIYDSIIDTIGATPLVRLKRLAEAHNVKCDLLAKCEFFNPLSSVKDRIGAAMIDDAEKAGKLIPGKSVIVEPTSGNTGIALAFVAASKGYRCILVMPDSMSVERRRMLKLLGAEIELTPAAQGMRHAISRAEELVKTLPHAFMPQQFENPANPQIHRVTTAEELWTDTNGKIDAAVCGSGTGGTLTGVGSALKAKKPGFKLFAVEPEDSAVLSGGPPGPHKIQGMGPGFVPKVLDRSVIDEILRISNDNAIKTAREIAKLEGIAVGISSGAALAAAIEIGQRAEMTGKMVAVILPDTGERYLSTALFDGL